MAKRRFPNSLVLIFLMIVVAQLLTYLLPSGEFERERRQVLAGTYQEVPKELVPWHAFLTGIPRGMTEAADIIFLVFIVGGVLGVVRATGAIDALIGATIRKVGHRRPLLVGGMVTLFAIGSATIGMAEEYVPFIPILVTMCLALKMDAIVAMGIVFVGYGVGYGCAGFNPFTVVIAQDVAGLETFSGWQYRTLLLAVCLAIGIHHILQYARRTTTDPSRSLVEDVDYSEGFELPKDTVLNHRRALILSAFGGGIALFVYGVACWDWYLTELSAVFLGIGLVAAAVGFLSPNRTATEFCQGAAELTTTALLIGFARTIEVVLTDGQVIDTVIHGIAGPLERAGPEVSSVGMLGVQTACNLFIPSGSGQAYVTMPIMAPLADLTGVGRQTAVLAYQFGDGFTNTIVPTNAVLMGMLALGKIPYQRWLRFMLPLLAKIYVVAIIALVLAAAFGEGLPGWEVPAAETPAPG